MQEVFIAIWRTRLPGFRRGESGQSFRGWLRVIVRNKVADHYRRQAGLPPVVEVAMVPDQPSEAPNLIRPARPPAGR